MTRPQIHPTPRLLMAAICVTVLLFQPSQVVAADPALPNILGNGVIVSPDGHVLTPVHLVAGRKEVALRVGDKREMAQVIATDADLDLAILKLPGQGYPRAILAETDRSHKDANLCLLGGPAKHNVGKLFCQGDVQLFTRFGPVAATEKKNVLALNGPANPGLDGSGLFDFHGDLIGLFNTNLTGHPAGKARALDIRAVVPLLKKHNVPFTTGGAPIEHSLADLHRLAAPSIVMFTPNEWPQMHVEFPLKTGPVASLRKSISFLGRASAFSPDGKNIAVVRHLGSGSSARSEIILLDSSTGKELGTWAGQSGGVQMMRFSPDGKLLLALTAVNLLRGLEGKSAVWNVEKGAIWYELPPADDADFSSDGKLIALRVGDRSKSWRLGADLSDAVEVSVHEAETGKLAAQIVPGKHKLVGEMDQCLFLPKTDRLLTVGFWLNKDRNRLEALHLWDPRTGRLLDTMTPSPDLDLPKQGYVHARAAVSPDEKTLLLDGYSRDSMATAYDLPTCRARYSLPCGPGDSRQTLGSLFSPKGDCFALRSGSHTSKHIRLYDANAGTCLWMFNGEWTAAFSPDGRRVMQTLTNGIVVWDLPHE